MAFAGLPPAFHASSSSPEGFGAGEGKDGEAGAKGAETKEKDSKKGTGTLKKRPAKKDEDHTEETGEPKKRPAAKTGVTKKPAASAAKTHARPKKAAAESRKVDQWVQRINRT